MDLIVLSDSDSEELCSPVDSDVDPDAGVEHQRKSVKELKKNITQMIQSLKQYLQKVNDVKVHLQVERMQVLQHMNQQSNQGQILGPSVAAIEPAQNTTEENINSYSLDLGFKSVLTKLIRGGYSASDADDEMEEEEEDDAE